MGELHHARRRRQGGGRRRSTPSSPRTSSSSRTRRRSRRRTSSARSPAPRSRSTRPSSRASCWVREPCRFVSSPSAAPTSSSSASRSGSPGSRRSRTSTSIIPAGSFFALLGPSGCGKTTTLRLVAGLEEPTRGRILIGGKDVTDTKSHERPVNTVFQSYALFPHMTIIENVAFGLKRRRIADPVGKAHEALRLVELDHLAQRKPAAAVRRPAAARRPGARDREPPGAPAARRAARRPRPEAPPADAAGAQGASRRRSASRSST